MADNWGYVAAAYAVGVVALGGYWRKLIKRERELGALSASRADGPMRGRSPSISDHPRSEPASRHPRP
jgi:hypothetical protein